MAGYHGGLGVSCRWDAPQATSWTSEVALLSLPSNDGGGDALDPNLVPLLNTLRERATRLDDEGVSSGQAPLLHELG